MKSNIPYGYCYCGCGEQTKLATQNHPKYGWVKGEPYKYVAGHRSRINEVQPWEVSLNPHPQGLCMCGCGQPTTISNISNRNLNRLAGSPMRYIVGHHNRKPATRIFEKDRYSIDTNGCWVWQGYKDPKGYGKVNVTDYATGKAKAWGVHRLAYTLAYGELASGLVIDHMCENPSCYNLDHLQAVSHQRNIKLATIRSPLERTKEDTFSLVARLRAECREEWDGSKEFVEHPSGCWVWMLGISSRGYGRKYVSEERSVRYAHRLYYVKYIGPIPEGYVIHHKCETHICVNPEHLEAVTNAENVNYRWQKRKEGS